MPPAVEVLTTEPSREVPPTPVFGIFFKLALVLLYINLTFLDMCIHLDISSLI